MNASLPQVARPRVTFPHVDASRDHLRAPSLVAVVAVLGIAACVAYDVANARQVADGYAYPDQGYASKP